MTGHAMMAAHQRLFWFRGAGAGACFMKRAPRPRSSIRTDPLEFHLVARRP